jgi:hypothetical protein
MKLTGLVTNQLLFNSKFTYFDWGMCEVWTQIDRTTWKVNASGDKIIRDQSGATYRHMDMLQVTMQRVPYHTAAAQFENLSK